LRKFNLEGDNAAVYVFFTGFRDFGDII